MSKTVIKKQPVQSVEVDILIKPEKKTREETTKEKQVIIGPDGKTCEIAEAERLPKSKRNRDREAEYDRLGIPNTTHPVDPK